MKNLASDLPPFAVYPGGRSERLVENPPSRGHQELWFSVARLHWASLVLVPADHGGSAADLATALAQVGTQLRDTPVTAVVASRIDFASARALAELQPRISAELRLAEPVEVEARPIAESGEAGASTRRPVRNATLLPPVGRAIIAIQPIVDEPLGLGVAQAADAVVLCVEVGKTRLEAARRTVELIGRERVIGVVLLT